VAARSVQPSLHLPRLFRSRRILRSLITLRSPNISAHQILGIHSMVCDQDALYVLS